ELKYTTGLQSPCRCQISLSPFAQGGEERLLNLPGRKGREAQNRMPARRALMDPDSMPEYWHFAREQSRKGLSGALCAEAILYGHVYPPIQLQRGLSH